MSETIMIRCPVHNCEVDTAGRCALCYAAETTTVTTGPLQYVDAPVDNGIPTFSGPQFASEHEKQCGICGQPYMVVNPHPDSGKPASLETVGAKHVCVPCTVQGRHVWYERACKAERELAASRERNELTTKLADQQSALLRGMDETITMLRMEVKELEKQLEEYRALAGE